MADFSQQESIFLGYNNPESLDIDFHDVFGGAPRRASIQEIRSSFRDSFELRQEDETIRRRWSGLGEKPVFGEEGVSRRRRDASDNFFDDIFGGNGSLSASQRDPFNLNYHKKKDSISNGLFSDSRFSSKVEDDCDKWASIEQFHGDSKDSTDSQAPSFHFNIHKWASKGVPLPLKYSSKTKERFNLERSSSDSGIIACQGTEKDSPAGNLNKVDCDFGIFTATDEVKNSEEKSDQKSFAASTDGEKTPISSPHVPAYNRAKGKIKEFLKIYEQETSDRSALGASSRSRSLRWMENGKFRTHDEQNHWTRNICKDRPSTSTEKVDALPKEPEKRGSRVRTNVADSFPEKFQVKELTQKEAELQLADNNQEEIRVIDDKIRKWSQGKQGNIRALLSTLQYVLWSESGWKPVPLVEIIEENTVKRSYQRALLCLHPDKLQQKGATSNQKYIAEKVFDILQEAWTQFNSLGSL